MKLASLLSGLQYEILQGDTDREISAVVYDSRKVQEGGFSILFAGLDSNDRTRNQSCA